MKKMIMAIVPHAEAERVVQAIVEMGQTATMVESRSGVLRQRQQVLFSAVEEVDLEGVVAVIRGNCRHEAVIGSVTADRFSLGTVPGPADLGGAVVFIWDVDRVETY